jgi:hypothetical protein
MPLRHSLTPLAVVLLLCSCAGPRPATTLEIWRVTDAWHPVEVVALDPSGLGRDFTGLVAAELASRTGLTVRDASWTESVLDELHERPNAIYRNHSRATLLADFGVDAFLKLTYGAREDGSSHMWRLEAVSTHSGQVIVGLTLGVWQRPSEAATRPLVPASTDQERAAFAASELGRLLRIAGLRAPPN